MRARVLVIEDDPVLGPMLQTMLRLEGFEATVVAEGTSAVRVLESDTYQAAVLDVMLPGKDGVSIMAEIRGSKKTADLPVILLSAKTDSASTWAGWQAGCNLYMSKPFDPEDLIREVRHLMTAAQPPE